MTEQLVITGCARSGTTLMLRQTLCFDNTYTFINEIGFNDPKVQKAKDENPGKLIVTKLPHDLTRIDKIYRYGHKVLLMFRDGRDVVVSKIPGHHNYHITPTRWTRDTEIALRAYEQHKDQTLKIRCEDLARRPDEVVQQVADFVGRDVIKTWAEVGKEHGYKPVTTSRIGNWKNSWHAMRVKSAFNSHGDKMADLLITLGYEKDKQWLKEAQA